MKPILKVLPLLELISWFQLSIAAPSSFLFPANQVVFNSGEHPDWDPLEHSSGISPYHDAPGADIAPPQGCEVTAAAFLIRHSCIHANDDEWEEFMEPFANRVAEARGSFPADSPLGFLNSWESPITASNAEQLTKPGAQDAFTFGKRFRKLYPHLLPPKHPNRKEKSKVNTPFLIWSASSDRDISTAKAFIRGAFPKAQEGHDGEGDGKYLRLVEVPNRDADWSASLTPHKVCKRFTKDEGRADGHQFLEHWGPAAREKLQSLAPSFGFELNDVIAIHMLCGYESVINGVGTSQFCRPDIFDTEDWKNFEYYFDLVYHKMVGYASPVAPQLGIHWVNTSTHNLLSAEEGEGDHPHELTGKDPHLPDPDRPPNATHSQRLFPYFTHREEPAVALVALGLWNQTKWGPLPLDRRVDDRVWRTSHVLPFLGHVALERIRCRNSASYIRTIVNGAVQVLEECSSGPGNSCPIQDFAHYVQSRMETYGDFEGVCQVDEERHQL